jgi:hypothetical protein
VIPFFVAIGMGGFGQATDVSKTFKDFDVARTLDEFRY